MQDDPIRIPLRARDGSVRAYALIDREDAHLAERRWFLNAMGYVARNAPGGRGVRKMLRLHRVILGLDFEDPRQVDHINGDPLDNRRANLRVVTHAQNHQNLRSYAGSTSNHRGVNWDARRERWRAEATLDGRRISLGRFDSEAAAAGAISAWRVAHMPFTNERRAA